MTQPTIQQLIPVQDTVERYSKYEVTLHLSASYTNPYDYTQVAVTAQFTSPSGESVHIDGFYMEEFDLDEVTGQLSTVGETGVFKLRFAPTETGAWTYTVRVTDATGTSAPQSGVLYCTQVQSPLNRGFVRTDLTNYLHTDDGAQYIPIGENMAWPVGNPYLDYRDWLTELSANGGNFIRLWHAHWGLGIEWKAGWNGFDGLRRYHQRNSRYQDWLFDYCAERGIYIMLCLQHHGQVSTQVNPEWHDNPYRTDNGGTCDDTWDFFTDAAARTTTHNRLRYVLARWGYARSVLAWELFNEVDWTDDFLAHRSSIVSWHSEMADYLKTHDPYQHLVTTSYANDTYEPLLWNHPAFDLTQTHFYINTANIERALVGGLRDYLDQYAKPTLNGEFGLGADGIAVNEDPDGIHLHNAIWAGLYGGGLGSAMTWWWDSYVHPQDLYHHFLPLATVAADVPFRAQHMAPAESRVLGAPGDLTLTPSLGWGSPGDAEISVTANGQTTPADPDLSYYLYGSVWNTAFRSPPTFTVDYPASGAFRVKTAQETGTAPELVIYVDDVPVLQSAATVNTVYEIMLSPGVHSIRVDNAGTDWISIASYTFEGLGSRADAYALVGEDGTSGAGWLVNPTYNHDYLATEGTPDAVIGATLAIDGFAAGAYTINWYDCLTGELMIVEPAFAENGTLTVAVPDLYWDMVFRVDAGMVEVADLQPALEFSLAPNPIRAGDRVRLSVVSEQATAFAEWVLYDALGQELVGRSVASLPSGQHSLALALPAHLPTGLYWLKLRMDERAGSLPVVVH